MADNETRTAELDRWGLAPIPLEQIHRLYAHADHWPLEDAIRLLMALPPRALAPESEDVHTQRSIAANLDIARNCLGHSLPEARGHRVSDEPRVRPIDAITWATSIGRRVPETLAYPVRERAKDKGLADTAGQPKTRKLLPQQIHRHRCAGIAALLWEQDPNVPVSHMAQRPELRSAGCGGQDYAQPTFEKWIKPEKPGGTKPGRPTTST